MAGDRSFRSLTSLSAASTSRVLNLLALTGLHGDNEEFCRNALFSSPHLNSAIIVKHRLRGDERDMFISPRANGTKLIFAFEKNDLRSGGKSLFVGQRGYEALLQEAGHYRDQHSLDQDLKVLELLDKIPSLDPFLLREHLRNHDVAPDARYFDISEADQQRMFDYASVEISRLTGLAGAAQSQSSATAKMVSALLSNEVGEKLEPLRLTLQLDPTDFREGIFSWRGFIYYKWSLVEFWPDLIRSLRQIKVIKPVGPTDAEQKTYLETARQAILRGAKQANDDINRILGVYNSAYEGLIEKREARQFREFLLSAPSLFLEIGEKMAALSHITSFWRYRFPRSAAQSLDADEMVAIFQDFAKGFTAESKSAMH
jgi:hypothetical protein